LHLIGPTEVEILADDFLEEAAARVRSVKHVRERELRLEDRELIAVAGGAVGRCKGMGQATQPLPEDRVDLGGIEGVRDALHAPAVGTRPDAVVQRFERDLAHGQLAFQPLMALQTELGGVGKVRTEL
jgi:hypothetical protein